MTVETTVPEAPVLRGSRCADCGNVAFPEAAGCQRCGGTALSPLDLARRGTVWAHTVQRFAPKSPPYVPPAGGFAPFAVGYVELPDGVRVEAVLDAIDIDDPAELTGAVVTLVATEPVPRFATRQHQEAGR
ncbi:DNA-binding protein [Pimelobacter simplex]|uniref:Uncharacterized protein n=1 Tax=Nocardioides simplex TaxID=2045 RepID=A0A0A1DH64_NOCSI|nr:OB-fold domain-containing protein [Pimelobacter simplex]AIY15868.1 hypothetical protein KR76_02115 [Pimelobacter simplex]MCG8154532.1 DNA-binding protein [Pimelobacter simplex]GEB12579.1 hypothetical protein NSI01_08940 [Pimelobacter simplex]SFM93053.1 Rubredoxin-like zinc ribbon domain [Pimelobacter simplex]